MVEQTPALEAYVAVLSGGPVGPSDQVGTANVSLIMATWYKWITILSFKFDCVNNTAVV